MPIMGYVRIDPRLHKKLVKLADKHDLVMRDLVNFILEQTEPKFAGYAEDLDRLVSEEEEGDLEPESETEGR